MRTSSPTNTSRRSFPRPLEERCEAAVDSTRDHATTTSGSTPEAGHGEPRATAADTARRADRRSASGQRRVTTMTGQRLASWVYAEEFVPEDDRLLDARASGERLGATPVGASTGAALRVLAATLSATSVVEIGTGAGVSGLWLLRGMPADGVLTTIDTSAEHQRSAKASFAAEGIPHHHHPSSHAARSTQHAAQGLPRRRHHLRHRPGPRLRPRKARRQPHQHPPRPPPRRQLPLHAGTLPPGLSHPPLDHAPVRRLRLRHRHQHLLQIPPQPGQRHRRQRVGRAAIPRMICPPALAGWVMAT